MRGARLPLTFGLVAAVVVVAFVLTRSPPVTAATNSVAIEGSIGSTSGGAVVCQAHEALPAHTTGVRISLEAANGPRVKLEVLARRRIVTHGERGSGWSEGSVTVPVTPLPRAVTNVDVCFTFKGANELVTIYGASTSPRDPAQSNAGALAGRLRIEYLRSGHTTWWSSIASVARRLGLGRAWAGSWIALLVLVLMTGAVAATSWLVLRELR